MECSICGEKLRGRYYKDKWNQTVHDYHEIYFCSSCNRITDQSACVHTPDGRSICKYCAPTIVKTAQQKEWVEAQVHSILVKAGFFDIPLISSIEIVSKEKLKSLSNTDSDHQYGLTITSYSGGLMLNSSMKHLIYILETLPKVIYAGVLAHEILHAWQNQNRVKMSPPLTEGFCNLGSHIVYANIGHPLAKHQAGVLQDNPDSVYGDGFRFMYKQSKLLGIEGLIKKVKMKI